MDKRGSSIIELEAGAYFLVIEGVLVNRRLITGPFLLELGHLSSQSHQIQRQPYERIQPGRELTGRWCQLRHLCQHFQSV